MDMLLPMSISTFLFISSLFSTHLSSALTNVQELIVLTSLGQVRGRAHRLLPTEDEKGEEIGLFLGIPFAQPPVDELRFERPKLPSKWLGIRSAEKPRAACHGWPEREGIAYSDDCLYLNIMVPLKANNSSSRLSPTAYLCPVLVIIHGGGFESGSSHTYGNYADVGAKFVSRGIVVVAFNYRLGWNGFGSTGTAEMPGKSMKFSHCFGNLGLWDQLAALRFIRSNIRAFGGDPEQITLHGYSAGSVSVSLLTISPLSRDLFARSIQMSGSPLCAWALNERVVNVTLELARILGCPESESVKRCFLGKPSTEIWEAAKRIPLASYADVSKWTPRVDGDFLPVDVPQLLREATASGSRKPTLMGFVDLESLRLMNNSLAAFHDIPWAQPILYDRGRFEASVAMLVAKPEYFGDLAAEVGAAVVEQYLKEDLLAEFSGLHALRFEHYYLQRYMQLLSDLNFVVPILTELDLRTQLGWPTHFYVNVHYNRLQFVGPVKVHQNFHTNDENFLFREAHFPFDFELSEDDRRMEQQLVNVVANFVKFGDPSPPAAADDGSHQLLQWLPTSPQRPTQHLRITATPMMEQRLEHDALDRFQFWRHFLLKYGHRWDPVRGTRGDISNR